MPIHFGPPHAVLNLSKIGLRYFRIGINASTTSKQRITEQLTTHPNVGWIFYAAGYCNLAIGFWAKDNAEINDVSQQVRAILSSDDEIVFQSELTSLWSFGNRPATGSGDPMCIVDASMQPATLSPLEIDYIKLIAMDSSLPQTELSEILNIPKEKVQDLHDTLTKTGVIVGEQARIQYQGTYYKIFIDSLSRKQPQAETELIERLWTDPACIYFERANSKYDLECELILRDESLLENYLSDFSDYKIAILTKNVYTNLFPVNKVANLKEIKEAILKQPGKQVDLRNSKLWYLAQIGVESYLNIYSNNEQYTETMEKGELDLFDEIVTEINKTYPNQKMNIIDIGSGDGLKGKAFIKTIGEKHVKAYYPVDIQPIELAAALNAHTAGSYAKHPTLVDIEHLSSRFPLKTPPNERQFYIFLGGTYGNFPELLINQYLKSLIADSSTLLIAMPIIKDKKTDADIINSYSGTMFDTFVYAPLSQVGFERNDFQKNPIYPDMVAQMNIEDHRLVSSLILNRDVTLLDRTFAKGTQFKVSSSWKPTFDEFRAALLKDFIIEKMFHNDDMAIAWIEKIK